MITVDIPGLARFELSHMLLDLNGTIAVDGVLLPGIAPALAPLRDRIGIGIVTADTYGAGVSIAEELGVGLHVVERGREAEGKLELVESLGGLSVVHIGNGANDVDALAAAAVGIAVVGPEGASARAVAAADVVVAEIEAAIGLLTHPTRLVATLRR